MRYVGVDGCAYGWIAVFEGRCDLDYQLFRSFDEIVRAFAQSDRVLIDIPIGLPNKAIPKRRCDLDARKKLGKRGSSVFPTPSRAATSQLDRLAASRRNFDELGCGLSAQSFGICKKIREVDVALRRDHGLSERFLEMHPELCFWALNGARAMEHPKHESEGRHERLSVLMRQEARTVSLVERVMGERRRKDVQADDVLDAITGLVTARIPVLKRLGEPTQYDEYALPMQMVFAESH